MGLYNECGIYMIKNIVNNKVYIGYTNMNFGDRRDAHFSELRNGYHYNKKMQEEFNKYGEDSFEFIVIELIHTKDDSVLKKREIYYIDKFDSVLCGYNISTGGNNFSGVRPSKEKIRRIAKLNREMNTGKKANEITREKMSAAHNNPRLTSKDGYKSILTPEEVANIKLRLMNGDSVNIIAKEYGVSFSCISQINVNKNWKRVKVQGWDAYQESRNN